MARAIILSFNGATQMTVRPSRREAEAWAIRQLTAERIGSRASVHEGDQLVATFKVRLLAGRPHIVGQSCWPKPGPMEIHSPNVGAEELSRAIAELEKEGVR
jgi:hypothetical protein